MRECSRCRTACTDDVGYCPSCGTRVSALDIIDAAGPEGRVGSVVGSYRLLRLVGEGGMGTVYLAEHTRLGRRVALKLLRTEVAGNIKCVKRFFDEARAVNKISHAHIIEITDFIEDESGDTYYIMEFLDGTNLHQLISREGILPLRRMLTIAVQVCSALAAAHDANIVHRDLKPDNVFLTTRGGQSDFVKLLDFGIAKLAPSISDARGETSGRTDTAAGVILGTPEYMSPEQASGSNVDFRTDIYALGVILYELVTGTKPFTGKTFGEVVIKHVSLTPPRPSTVKNLPHAVPFHLDELILHCLEKDADDRPQAIRDVETRLKAILERAHVEAESPPPPPPDFGSEPKARSRWLLGTGAFAAFLAVLGIGSVALHRPSGASALALGYSAHRSEPSAPPAPSPPTASPRSVTIALDSTPTGADVFRDGDGPSLGVTPLTLSMESASRVAKFEFRLKGYPHVHKEMSLEQSGKVSASFATPPKELTAHANARRETLGPRSSAAAQSASSGARAESPKPPAFDKGAVIDPFE